MARALWHYQDLWLASASTNPSPVAEQVDGGPDGRIYKVSLKSGSRNRLEGWSVHPGRPERGVGVEVWRHGEGIARARPDEPRPDMAHNFGCTGAWRAGWRLTVEPPAGGSSLRTPLPFKAKDGQVLEKVLHLGTVETLLADRSLHTVQFELSLYREGLQDAHVNCRELHEELSRGRVVLRSSSRVGLDARGGGGWV